MSTLWAEIRLRGIKLQMRIGVDEEERIQARPMLVDLSLRVPLPLDADERLVDELGSTVDYALLHEIVVATAAAGPYRLVESFAVELRRRINQRLPQAAGLRLCCSKPAPPLSGEIEAAEIILPVEEP